jgi:hypothetical protein
MTYEHKHDPAADACKAVEKIVEAHDDLKIIVELEGEIGFGSKLCKTADAEFCENQCESHMRCGKLVGLLVIGVMASLTRLEKEDREELIRNLVESKNYEEFSKCEEAVGMLFKSIRHLNVC